MIVTLREAEQLRSCLHISARTGNPLLPGSSAGIAIRLLPSGRELEHSSGFQPGPAKFQAAAAAQLSRFLDCATDYTSKDLSVLQRLLGAAPAETRYRFFNELRACKRRAQVPTAETAVGHFLAGAGQLGSLRSRAVAARMRFQLAKKGLRIADGFAAMDTDHEVVI